MNILKFYDHVMTEENLVTAGLAEWNGSPEAPEFVWKSDCCFAETGVGVSDFCAWFNDTLRGQWVLNLNCSWICALTPDNYTQYVYQSQNPDSIREPAEGLPMDSWQIPTQALAWFVDWESTNKKMEDEFKKYQYLNEFTPDGDVTLEELKAFRMWLASILLANEPLIESRSDARMLENMLRYYKHNMYSPVIKEFIDLQPYIAEPVLVTGRAGQTTVALNSGCGCSGGMPRVDPSVTTQCDAVQMYRNGMYSYMVQVFSDIQYWIEQREICVEMKKYIDGILKAGLVLSSPVVDPYADCTCTSANEAEEQRYRTMLTNLSRALQLIIDNQVEGSRNMVGAAFHDWAAYLYEQMYWL